MTEKKMDVVAILNDLVQYCKNAEKGFEEASRDVRDEEYRKMFLGYSRRMSEFTASLQQNVVKLGGSPRQEGSVTGQVHRAWMQFRSMLNLHHAEPVLLECEKEEESLLDHYQNAVESGLPQEIKDIVEKQFVEIIEIRNHLKDLETAGKSFSPAEHKFIS